MSTKLTPETLTEIREWAEKATVGPWVVTVGDSRQRVYQPDDEENAEFIAHARTDIPALLDHITALEEERERLLNLVRYCRHELLDKDLITQDEFASLLEEGSAAKLETYDQLRAQIAAADELHVATVAGKIALEGELKAAQGLVNVKNAMWEHAEDELDQIRECDKCDLCEDHFEVSNE